MFGTTLEEVMEMQKEKFPDCEMPWVVQALVDAVIQLQGPTTEGIFRLGFYCQSFSGLHIEKNFVEGENLQLWTVP